MRTPNKVNGTKRPLGALRHVIAAVACAAVVIGTTPAPLRAQPPPPAQTDQAEGYSAEQLDALLAPIALYPDELLTQVLIASVYPLEIVDAARWAENPANKSLTGDALTQALVPVSWDPSVKSLVPFPQVLTMMNSQLDWTQQLGYAMAVQQSDVMASIQRLRRQAQIAGQLKSSEQQVVRTEGQTIVIAPAQPSVVYVPVYNPSVVYGTWPYPAYPPVYYPPPPGYAVGNALLTGLAFGAGVAITASLWGWARPNWGGGYMNVNVNRYNNINVNRTQIHNSNWRATNVANRPGGAGFRAPANGPVGRPARAGGLPANSVGRSNVSVPGGVVRPPGGMGPGNRPPIGQNGGANRAATRPAQTPGNRPNAGQGAGQGNRPNAGQGAGANRPNAGQGNRPNVGQGAGANRPNAGQGAGNRPQVNRPTPAQRPAGGGRNPPALSGMNDGRAASQFGNRGAQSRQASTPRARPSGGGGGGPRAGGGGGGARTAGGHGRGR
nr:DUF3300 domain-containing protein [uncultured Rhodopila sp.]